MPDSKKPTVAIIYGLAEGKRIGKKFRLHLAEHGFSCVDDIMAADIILTHSGGVLAIPSNCEGKTVLIVGPSVAWAGSIISAIHKKIGIDVRMARAQRRMLRLTTRSVHNLGYLVRQSPMFRTLWRIAHERRNELPLLTNCRVGIIMLKDDPITGLDKLGLHNLLPYAFIQLDRLHDDLWDNPDDYISILRYLHTGSKTSRLTPRLHRATG
jgi:hypothetical protein